MYLFFEKKTPKVEDSKVLKKSGDVFVKQPKVKITSFYIFNISSCSIRYKLKFIIYF